MARARGGAPEPFIGALRRGRCPGAGARRVACSRGPYIYARPRPMIPQVMNRRALLLPLPLASCSGLLHPPLPAFHAVTLNGERFDNASTQGRPMLLQMWTTWCGDCRSEQPLVDTLDAELSPGGLIILAVNAGEPRETVTGYLRQSPRRTRVVAAEDTNLSKLYGHRGLPFYLMVNREGRLAGELRGAYGEAALRSLIQNAV